MLHLCQVFWKGSWWISPPNPNFAGNHRGHNYRLQSNLIWQEALEQEWSSICAPDRGPQTGKGVLIRNPNIPFTNLWISWQMRTKLCGRDTDKVRKPIYAPKIPRFLKRSVVESTTIQTFSLNIHSFQHTRQNWTKLAGCVRARQEGISVYASVQIW